MKTYGLKIIPTDNMGRPERFCLVRGDYILSEHATRQEAERAKQVANGRVWTVTSHESVKPEITFFEGTRTACVRWLKENRQWRNYRAGREVRLGQIIFENPQPN